MISRNASRDAKYSIVAMVFSGLAVSGILVYVIDKLLFEGLFAARIVKFCQGLEATCQSALLSISLPPVIFLTVVFSAALVFAILRAGMILFSAKRQSANFLEASDAQVSGSTIKFKKAIQRVAGLERVPEIKVLAGNEPLAFTAGLFKPCIYLSQGLIGTLNDKELEAVVLHEFAHIKRRDNLAIFGMLFLRNFLFVLPLAHFLFTVYIREKENAADDYAVAEMKEPASLASAILRLARLNHLKKDPSPAYATFFPSRATAQSRITRLVGDAAPKRAKEVVNLVLAAVVSVLIVILLTGATFQASAANNSSCARSGIVCKDKANCSGGNHNCCTQPTRK